MSLAKARESLLKAHELKNDNTRFYREFNDKVRAEISAIRDDRYLSEDGRAQKIAEVRERRGKELLRLAHARRQEFRAHLADAQKHAEAVIYAKIPKPSEEKIERFTESLRKLKTELMLSGRAESAAAKLTQFIGELDDPYLAHKVSIEYADLAGSILAIADPSNVGKLRMDLSRQYDGLSGKYEDPDANAARDALETATEMDKSSFFIGLVHDSVRETLGTRYSSFINSTDTYFEQNPDDLREPAGEQKARQIG